MSPAFSWLNGTLSPSRTLYLDAPSVLNLPTNQIRVQAEEYESRTEAAEMARIEVNS